MKHVILCLSAAFFTFFASAQTLADPAITQVSIISLGGNPITPSQLAQNDVVQLQMRILNNSASNVIPAGSMKLKIGLGSKAQLDPSFIIANAPLSNYFSWTSITFEGQVEITGDLIANIPAGFAQNTQFRILGNILGNSTITINFLVTNHNTFNNLSDENGSNNFASLAYIVNPPLPLTFKEILLKNSKCNIEVVFNVQDEVDVSRYQIEASKDGANFASVGSLPAKNLPQYSYTFPITSQIESNSLFVRIKSIDKDGSIMYSNVGSVSGKCAASSSFNPSVFPNPVNANLYSASISNQTGIFDGEYHIRILDVAGKTVNTQKIRATNQKVISINLQGVGKGEYYLLIKETSGENAATLKLKKL